MSEIHFEYLDPDEGDVQAILAASDAFYDGLYPAESNHIEAVDDLKKPGVALVGCRVDGILVASAAAKQMTDDGEYAEIKRVYSAQSGRRGSPRAGPRRLAARHRCRV